MVLMGEGVGIFFPGCVVQCVGSLLQWVLAQASVTSVMQMMALSRVGVKLRDKGEGSVG